MAEDEEMREFYFRVTVKARNRKEAEQVMAERILHDGWYGFPYRIHIDGTSNNPNGDHAIDWAGGER